MQTFLGNGDQQVGGYSDPYLRLDRVLLGAKEHFDAQMLLDPFEEQLHLPTLAVQRRRWLGRSRTAERNPDSPGLASKMPLPQ